MARSARTAPTTAQPAPSRPETLPAASSWRSAQTPLSPASAASSPQPLRTHPPHQILYHDHCSWLLQRFPNARHRRGSGCASDCRPRYWLRQRRQRRSSCAALRGGGRCGGDNRGQDLSEDSSLRPGGRQVLVSIEEFQGKIEAARLPDGPLVVARTEALIAGLGQAEALRRGAAYAEAGADAVLIHSKEKTPHEVLEFCRAWPGQVPLVLVPTAYPQVSFAEIAALGKVGLIICANHAIRAAVAAMRTIFARILAEGGIAGAESSIASVADIFRLQGDDRVREIETRFLR